MNKRFILPVSLIILIGLVVFVSAADIKYNCIDSDKGLDISTKGKTSGQEWGTGQSVGGAGEEATYSEPKFIEVEDYCSSEKAGRLIEYYCYGGLVGSQSYGPEDGCSECINGTCVITPIVCKNNDCNRNGVCYSPGDKIGQNEYCSAEGNITGGNININLQEGDSCTHDYECSISDVCYNKICVDNLPNLFVRMWDWFKGIF